VFTIGHVEMAGRRRLDPVLLLLQCCDSHRGDTTCSLLLTAAEELQLGF
jgi:hypothetical protein